MNQSLGKRTRRILAALLALCLFFGLSACGSKTTRTQSGDTSSPEGGADASPTADPVSSPSPTAAPTQDPATLKTIATVVDIDGPLNIRDKPTTEDSTVIGQANAGDRFEVSREYCDEDRGWHEILYEDGQGGKAYVSAEFTELSQGTLDGPASGSTSTNGTPSSSRPIVVNGSGRPDTSPPATDGSEAPLSAETIRTDEDAGRR